MRVTVVLAVALLCPGIAAARPPADDQVAVPTADRPAAEPPVQHDAMGQMTMDPSEHQDRPAHHHGAGALGAYPATRDASGTAWQPDSATHDGLHLQHGGWTIAAHGEATLIYDDQGGPRGARDTFVLSHFVLDAQRSFGGGTLTLRTLFSLDPLIGQRGYPLLFQTGETADGRTRLIDRQHPHDLIGELAAVYSHPVAPGVSAFLYGGPAGEPALGPPVYLHRATGLADPETPIDHHWLDSTHLAFGVVTGGVVAGGWKLEGSGFKGREPDQHRYDIERPALDSWSVRLSWNPAVDWALQVSRGHLHSPEQLEPDVDQTRTTASAIYNRPRSNGFWQTVLAWGRIDNGPARGAPATERAVTSDAYLAESTFAFGRNAVFGRVEHVTKDELFPEGSPLDGQPFDVSKASLGYQRTIELPSHLAVDVGGLVSRYAFPRQLDATYGASPTSFLLYMRLHLRS